MNKKLLLILALLVISCFTTQVTLEQAAAASPSAGSGRLVTRTGQNSGKLQKYSSGHPITLIPSFFKGEQAPYKYDVSSKEFNNDDDISMSFWFRWSWVSPGPARYSGNQWIPVGQVSETGACGTSVGDQLLKFAIKPDENGQPAYSFSTYTLQGAAKSLFIQTSQSQESRSAKLNEAPPVLNVYEILKSAVCDVFCEKYQEQQRIEQENLRRLASASQSEREAYAVEKLAKDKAAGLFKTALDKYVECSNGLTASGEVCKNGENQNAGTIQITLPLVDNNDFDGSWNWIYMGYSRLTKQVYIYTQLTQSNKIISALVQKVVHRAARPKLYFQLGKCNSSPFQFNGHYFDQRFEFSGKNFRGNRAEVQAFLRDIVLRPPQLALAIDQKTQVMTFTNKNNNYVNKQIVSFSDSTVQSDGGKKKVDFDITEATGPLEYAIYGWAKWAKSNLDGPQNLFRVSLYDSQAEQDNTKPGDRLLGAQIIKKGGKEILQLQAFNFKYNFDVDQYAPLYNDVDPADDLSNWLWIYAGYSFPQSKVSFFIQFQNRNLQWEISAESIMPFRLRGSVGGSNFGNPFVGSLQDWSVDYGSGAFLNKNYLSIQKYDPYSVKNQSKTDTYVVPATNKIADNSKNQIIDAGGSADKRVEPTTIPVDNSTLLTVKNVAFHFWARTSFEQLFIQDMANATNPRIIAGVTETGNLLGSAMGDTALAIIVPPFSQTSNQPCFRFITYAQNRAAASESIDIPIDKTELDHNWIWFYFGYNYELQKAIGYVYFSGKGTIKSKEFATVVHITPINSLTFQVYDGKTNWPSLMASIVFRTDSQAFKATDALVTYYRETYVDKAPSATINSASYTVVNCVATYGDSSKAQNLAPIKFYDQVNAFYGAQKYAVYGKFKYSGTPNSISERGLGIFSLNYYDSQSAPLLSLTLQKQKLVFSAASFDFSPAAAKFKQLEIAITNEDISSQIFFYAGYDASLQKATIYVQLAKGPQTLTIENLFQNKPSVGITITIGTIKNADNFIGTYQNLFVLLGEKSVINDFLKLQQQRSSCEGDFGENNIYYESDNSKGAKTFATSEFKDEELPKIDKFSFWTWFRFSLSQPSALPNGANGIKNNQYIIARAQATADIGMRATYAFDANGIPSVKIYDSYSATGGTGSIELPQGEKGLDTWHFIYMSHDNKAQQTFAAVFFHIGEIRTATITNSLWARPFEFLRFRLAGVVDGTQQFNGYFYDGQFSSTSDGYANSITDAARVFGVVTIPPPIKQNPKLLEGGGLSQVKIADGDNTLININETRTDLIWKEIKDFENPQQYSIGGFFKLRRVDQADNYTVLYRFSNKKKDAITNDKAFGDRTFQLGYTQSGDLIFDTYNSSTLSAEGKNVISTTVAQVKIDERWTFFFQSYNMEKQELKMYLKFADGNEFTKTLFQIQHDFSEVFTYFLGKDNFYNGFNGQLKDVWITFGFDQTKSNMTARKDQAPTQTADEKKKGINTLSDTPLDQTGDCIIVYSKCQYQGNSQTLCQEDPQINFIIYSIYVPKSQAVRIFGDNMFNGRYQDFYDSNACISGGGGAFMLQNKFKITYNNKKLDEDTHTVNVIREQTYQNVEIPSIMEESPQQIKPENLIDNHIQNVNLIQKEEQIKIQPEPVKQKQSHHDKKQHSKHLKSNLKI